MHTLHPILRILFLACLILVSPLLPAQGTDGIGRVLDEIERCNSSLQALRKEGDAAKYGLRGTLALPDPEAKVGYLWGKPSGIGRRKNVEVSQSLDLATLGGIRRRALQHEDRRIDGNWRVERMNVLLEARLLCLDVVYYNALIAQLDQRLANAEELAVLTARRLDAGHTDRMDLNGANLELATVRGETERALAEREAARMALRRLGAGESVALLTDTVFPAVDVPADFETWYNRTAAGGTVLSLSRQDIETGRSRLAVAKAERWPQLSVGFTAEYLTGERFQGISVGLSVPLWSGKRRMQQARADLAAAEARHDDTDRQYRGRLAELYRLQDGLRRTADTYAEALRSTDSTPLLRRALDEGSISLMDYLQGVRLYYDTQDRYLAALRDWHKACAEMLADAIN